MASKKCTASPVIIKREPATIVATEMRKLKISLCRTRYRYPVPGVRLKLGGRICPRLYAALPGAFVSQMMPAPPSADSAT